jgi:hypothetical protein
MSHSYTAPGEEHVVLELERFYEIEVNGVRCSIGWNSCFPVNRRRRPRDECKAD